MLGNKMCILSKNFYVLLNSILCSFFWKIKTFKLTIFQNRVTFKTFIFMLVSGLSSFPKKMTATEYVLLKTLLGRNGLTCLAFSFWIFLCPGLRYWNRDLLKLTYLQFWFLDGKHFNIWAWFWDLYSGKTPGVLAAIWHLVSD